MLLFEVSEVMLELRTTAQALSCLLNHNYTSTVHFLQKVINFKD